MRFPFGRKQPRPAQAFAEALQDQIIAAVRQPVFYTDYAVPDTFMGRFELLVLLATPILRRLSGGSADTEEIAQELVDGIFRRLDISMRELGVGDVTVPKRMKKLAQAFRGRSIAYDEALGAGDRAALALAIGRNVLDGRGDGLELAGFLLQSDRELGAAAFDPHHPEMLRIPTPRAMPEP